MRAVNLMPVSPRAVGERGADRPVGAFVLIAGLAVLVVFAAVSTMIGRQVNDRSAQLKRVSAEARAAEARGAGAAGYKAFAELARKRSATVTSLSATRFDWANALHETSRVLPSDVWLMSLNGTSGATVSTPEPESSAAPSPSLEIQGCTGSQADVARLMVRLRAVDRVRSVDLTSSVKPDTAGGDQCPANRPSDPVFTIVVRFAAPGESRTAIDSTGQVKTAAGSAPAPANSPPPSKSSATSVPGSTKGAR